MNSARSTTSQNWLQLVAFIKKSSMNQAKWFIPFSNLFSTRLADMLTTCLGMSLDRNYPPELHFADYFTCTAHSLHRNMDYPFFLQLLSSLLIYPCSNCLNPWNLESSVMSKWLYAEDKDLMDAMIEGGAGARWLKKRARHSKFIFPPNKIWYLHVITE